MPAKPNNPNAPGKQERIMAMMRLMLDGSWITGKTVYQLAEKWGISPHTATRDSAEASRRIKEQLLPPGEIRARLAGLLEGIIKQSTTKLDRRGNPSPKGMAHPLSLRTAVEAIKAYADITGAKAPSKQEISGANGGPIEITGPTILVPPDSDD